MNHPLDWIIGQRHSTLKMKRPEVGKTMIRALIFAASGKKVSPGHRFNMATAMVHLAPHPASAIDVVGPSVTVRHGGGFAGRERIGTS
jgi:hypothetical protein